MRRVFVVLLLLLLLPGCAGTPQSREAGSTAVVSVLGLEPTETGIKLTAAAEGRGEEGPAAFPGTGATPAAAIEALTDAGQRVVSCAHVEHILLTQTAAPDLSALLSYAFQEPQQSTETQLWLVRTDTLDDLFSGELDVAQRMSVLKSTGHDRQGFTPLTLREAATALAEGDPLLIPALELSGEGLDFAGFGLYKDGKIVDWLTGASALGAALLAGERIHWTGSVGDRALTLQSAGCRVEVLENGTLSITCRVEGVRTGGWTDEAGDEKKLEHQTEQSIRMALTRLQGAGADGANLLGRAGLTDPLGWNALAEDWETSFPHLAPEVDVRLTVAERY